MPRPASPTAPGGLLASRIIWFLLASGVHQAAGILDPSDEEKRMVWKHPSCEHLRLEGYRRVNWLAFREVLHTHQYPDKVQAALEVLSIMRHGGSLEYDEETRVCLMGVPTAFYFLTRYTLDTIERDDNGRLNLEMLEKVALQYSVLENYISSIHPGIIDSSNWTITELEVRKLRRSILNAYHQVEGGIGTGRAAPEPPIRVYVYEEDEVPELAPLLQSQLYCSRGQWGTDVQIHDFFVTSACRTDDPNMADFFFVPGYAICLLEGNIYTLTELDLLYTAAVQALPYFNASGGRDHIFVFGSGMAHNVFMSWQKYIPRSIVLTPETELFNDFTWITEPPFHTWRDIVVPGSLDLTEVMSLISHSLPLAERPYLGAFFGRSDISRGAHPWVGGVDARQELLKLRNLSEATGSQLTGGDLLFGENATHDVMHAAYGSARFCFCPRGKSGWSLRLFEALFAGCVPVVISDRWELPFEDFLDVTRFVIKWPSTRIDAQLLLYLRSLPDAAVAHYMEEARKVRCWYFYPPKRMDVRGHMRQSAKVCPEENGQDAFRGVLRLLRARRRRSRTSPSSFYFRNAAGDLQVVDANLRPSR